MLWTCWVMGRLLCLTQFKFQRSCTPCVLFVQSMSFPTRTHSVMVLLLLAGRRPARSTPSRMARAALNWRT